MLVQVVMRAMGDGSGSVGNASDGGDGSGGKASDGERWGAADEASLACRLLTSCCAAWFLTGHGPVSVRSPGVEDPCSRSYFSTSVLMALGPNNCCGDYPVHYRIFSSTSVIYQVGTTSNPLCLP